MQTLLLYQKILLILIILVFTLTFIINLHYSHNIHESKNYPSKHRRRKIILEEDDGMGANQHIVLGQNAMEHSLSTNLDALAVSPLKKFLNSVYQKLVLLTFATEPEN